MAVGFCLVWVSVCILKLAGFYEAKRNWFTWIWSCAFGAGLGLILASITVWLWSSMP